MPCIFIDRDGVLNEFLLKDYIKSPQEWRWIPNSIKALRRLNQLGYKIFIVSNQSCINRKIISWKTISAIHKQLREDLLSENIVIEDIIICPHIDTDNCSCRKPKPGMLETLINIYQADKRDLIFVGDSVSDIKAGRSINIKVIGLKSGNPSIKFLEKPDFEVYHDLFDFTKSLSK